MTAEADYGMPITEVDPASVDWQAEPTGLLVHHMQEDAASFWEHAWPVLRPLLEELNLSPCVSESSDFLCGFQVGQGQSIENWDLGTNAPANGGDIVAAYFDLYQTMKQEPYCLRAFGEFMGELLTGKYSRVREQDWDDWDRGVCLGNLFCDFVLLTAMLLSGKEEDKEELLQPMTPEMQRAFHRAVKVIREAEAEQEAE